MGLLTDDEGNPRWKIGGFVLLLILALFLLPPLRGAKGIGHPRSGDQQIDLCALLSNPPLPVTGGKRVTPRDGGTACEFKNVDGALEMRVGVITTRQASVEGRAAHLSKMYDTWLKEVVASGAKDVRTQPGEWAMASSYADTRNRYVLVEDNGVFLTLSSDRLDDDALVSYARVVRGDLRKPPTK